MSQELFAYGTLRFAPVLRALAGRSFAARDAELEGFAVQRLRGRAYPGLVPAPGSVARGVLYLGLDAATLALLDRFEGPWYERRRVRVRSDGAEPWAFTYLLRPARHRELAGAAWDAERFAARHLATWIAACRAFRLGAVRDAAALRHAEPPGKESP